MEFVPSKYQQDIFDVWEKTDKNILVSAVAGSGKTKTTLELMKRTPEHIKGMYVAFNKHIVKEIQEKNPPSNFIIGTLHSRGYQAVARSSRTKLKLDEWKSFSLIKSHIKENADIWKDVQKNKINGKIASICEFWDYYRLSNQKDLSNFKSLVEKYNLNVSFSDIKKIESSIKVLNEYNAKRNNHNPFVIDFVDMIYLPVHLNLHIDQVDVLMIDEAQDLSVIQHEFVKKLLKEGGRQVVVGDPHQAIYNFGGSDIESWNKFSEMPNAVQLPLSFCYRCSKNIVNKANAVHNIMESPEWMQDGEIIEDGNLLYVKSGDFVLCRNTKPLVELYFTLLNLEKPCYIKGSDIGNGLIKVLDEHKKLSSASTLTEMNKELNKIYRELIAYGVQQPQKNPKYLSYKEKIDIVSLFAMKCKTTYEIIEKIKSIFSDDGKGIVLSTIHKAKGLEAEDVYIYLPSLLPSKYAETKIELEQEANLLYVAITRAKKKLTFVKNEFTL
jgi:superfamily I DNA/RNA helicase